MEIQNIFSACGEQITENDIVSIERRGTKPVKAGDRARLLVVKLRDATKKRHLFHNLQKFRDHQNSLRREDDQRPLVRVDHDMTRAQQAQKKALIAKAIEDSKNGPKKFRVRGPPWQLRIDEVESRAPLPQ